MAVRGGAIVLAGGIDAVALLGLETRRRRGAGVGEKRQRHGGGDSRRDEEACLGKRHVHLGTPYCAWVKPFCVGKTAARSREILVPPLAIRVARHYGYISCRQIEMQLAFERRR